MALPRNIRQKLTEATISVRAGSAARWFVFDEQGDWDELPLAGLTAVVPVCELQTIQLFGTHLAAGRMTRPTAADFGTFDLNLRVTRAAWHFVWPSAIFAFFMLLSRWRHDAHRE
jgi:hypothetical protein